MNLGRYGVWWRQRWVPSLFLAGLIGRLPLQMHSLAVLLLVHEETGSWTTAGAVTAAGAAGYAIVAPVQGRLVDRYGHTLPLTVMTLASSAGFLALLGAVLAGMSSWFLAVVAAVAGAALPPIAPAQRTLWSVVLPDPQVRQTALTVDSIMLDVGLIAGPLIVTGVTAAASPAASLVVTVAMLAIGTLWFSRLEPSWQQSPSPEAKGDLIGALRSSGVRTLVVGATLTGVVFGALRVGFIAVAEDHGTPDLGGVLIAFFGVGSLAGGLVYGARSWTGDPARRWIVLLAVYALGLAALSLVSWSLIATAVLAVVAGCVLTPQVVTEFELIPRCAPPNAVTEAYAWGITATFAGSAFGSSLGGFLAEEGPSLPIVACAASAGLAALVAWVWRRTLSPSPSTGEDTGGAGAAAATEEAGESTLTPASTQHT